MKITVIFAAFLLFVSTSFAQGSVEGTITDAKGAAVGRAVISLIDAKGTTVAKYTTDAEGYYTLDDVGTSMLAALLATQDMEQAVAQIASEYAADTLQV
ncbi:MAG TPA: carboxypeptidase-like regulatory domain-containing protein, partial [Pyrinomonadaceae bacterium]|nr:carboxypeptidase-like regulatory domain-containing protein [Pyrinomonadaceae bacterium]